MKKTPTYTVNIDTVLLYWRRCSWRLLKLWNSCVLLL